MLSWWRNLISYRVDYQCLVLTNSYNNLVGVIHTRGQHTRSHSTGEDFISLIVAVFFSEQLKAVWMKFGVLDFCRKRLIGVGSTLTFVENDQVLVYLDILHKGLYSVIIVFSEKVYFKSQILVHEYWTMLDHFGVPVLFASGCHQHVLKNVNITYPGNTGTLKLFQYSPILGRSSIWDLKYTFSVFSVISL